MTSHSETEILTADQFAQRLQVSRATLFNWMQKGFLVQGKHYFKRGHILRFIWSDDLIQGLLEESGEVAGKRQPVKPSAVPIQKEKSSSINWGY